MRWDDPFAGLTSLHQELDDMFNTFFSQPGASAMSNMPAMDVYTEDDKQMVAEVHLPGFSKNEVDVSVHEGILEIKGKREEKEEQKDKKRSYVVRQSSSSFYRRIALPKLADGEAAKADFKDGLLKITIPFKELPAPKKVEISESKPKK